MVSHHIMFFHNNARPYSKKATLDLPSTFSWDVFKHPLHSPNLAPRDFRLFPYLKTEFGGEYFTSPVAVKDTVHAFFQNQGALFYYAELSKLVTRYNKCLNIGGHYIEK